MPEQVEQHRHRVGEPCREWSEVRSKFEDYLRALSANPQYGTRVMAAREAWSEARKAALAVCPRGGPYHPQKAKPPAGPKAEPAA